MLSVYFTPVQAESISTAELCGNGSAPDYGFTYDLQQPHWTVGWEDYASEQTVNRVESLGVTNIAGCHTPHIGSSHVAQAFRQIRTFAEVTVPVEPGQEVLDQMLGAVPLAA